MLDFESDMLARYRWAVSQRHVPPKDPPGFNPLGLIEGHLGYFGSEEVMEEASVHHCLARGEAQSLPPVWVAQPEVDQNVPSEITNGLVAAYRKAGGAIEGTFKPKDGRGNMNRPILPSDPP